MIKMSIKLIMNIWEMYQQEQGIDSEESEINKLVQGSSIKLKIQMMTMMMTMWVIQTVMKMKTKLMDKTKQKMRMEWQEMMNMIREIFNSSK